MSLLRSFRRLRGMGPHEICTRARQEAAKRGDVLLYRLGVDRFHERGSDLQARGRFYCDAAETPVIVELLGLRAPEAVAETLERARRIAEHRFDLLGYRGLDFGERVDWSLDPVHGRRAANSPWPAIPYLNFKAVGDHKIVWELNRHQSLVTLAKAYRITGDQRFAAELKELWHDWNARNPYPVGMNWASTLEVAFRAISWVWVGFLLEGAAAGTPEFQQDLALAVARAGWYIERYLSTYFSPNTHLLGEGVALFLIGVRYPGLRHAARWKQTGWDVILEAATKQVRPDGFYFEQSTYYHVYALDLFLHARILAERNGIAVPGPLDQTIRGMLSALALLSQAGALPRYGDDDGGRVFDGSRNLPEHMRDPLSTGAVLFPDAGLKAAASGLCEETLWLLGPRSASVFDDMPARAPAPAAVGLRESGIYAMTGRGAPPAQLFIDGGPQGPGRAGHSHADALSVQLAAGGLLWLTDPGTCCYVGDGSPREVFRGTSAHNTLTVDGRDQAEPTGPFSWGPLPRVEVRRWVTSDAFDLFEGRHSGYERLPEPVLHRRWVVRIGARLWLVRDVAEGRGTHQFDIHWHFPPEVTLTVQGSAAVARRAGESLVLLGAAGNAWRLTAAEHEYSPAYGARVAAPVARWSATAACPVEFVTAIGFGEDIASATLTPMDAGAWGGPPGLPSSSDAPRCPPSSRQTGKSAPHQGVAGYEYAAGGERLCVFFAFGGLAWQAGEWGSDAAFLCFRTAAGGVRELIFTGGSYVDYAGVRAVETREPESGVVCRADSAGWRVAEPGDVLLNPEVLP